MSEVSVILENLIRDVETEHAAGLCVVVQTKGSTPQPAGACMLVRHDMSSIGTLGGGCVEAEVRKRAFELMTRGERSAMLDFVLDHDFGWDDGLICGGRMYFAVQVFAPGDDMQLYRAALDASTNRQPASFPLHVQRGDGMVAYRVNLDVPPTVVIAGAGYVGRAVAKLAADLDFRVVVIDDRDDMAHRKHFDERVELIVGDIARSLAGFPLDSATFVVIVTRGHQHDHQALDAVIRRDCAYIGLIGSRRKSDMILRDLAEAGVPRERLDRVHTPIGLPIGAITVPEIAVSIVAELIQQRRRRTSPAVEGPFDLAAVPASDPPTDRSP